MSCYHLLLLMVLPLYDVAADIAYLLLLPPSDADGDADSERECPSAYYAVRFRGVLLLVMLSTPELLLLLPLL